MHRLIYMCLDAMIAAVILIPLYAWLNKKIWKDEHKTVCFFLFSVYLAGMYSVVGLPDICYVRFSPNYNIQPFAYMFSDSESSLLNVLLFVPLGMLLRITCEKHRNLSHALLFGFSVSLIIELLQIFTYRASDINDLITNTAGTILGWAVGTLSVRWKNLSAWSVLDQSDIREICLISFSIMFWLHPFLEDLLQRLFA